jgi:hypothetical protein
MSDPEIRLQRLIDAPIEVTFHHWTDPVRVAAGAQRRITGWPRPPRISVLAAPGA